MTSQQKQTTESILAAFKLKEVCEQQGLDYAALVEQLTQVISFVQESTRQACAAKCMELANGFSQELADPDLTSYAANRKQNQLNGAVKCHEAILAMEV